MARGVIQRKAYLLRLIAAIALLSASLSLVGCGVASRMGQQVDGSWAGDMLFSDSPQMNVAIEADEAVNPDPMGQPLSVVLRIYQLRELQGFAQASMDQLWSDDEQVLADGMVSRREVTVLPDESVEDSAKLSPQAQYVGVAAFFRNPAGGSWRVAFDADAIRDDGILWSSDGVRLRLEGDRIEVVEGADLQVTSGAMGH
ncbi:type VI secretion system lipoprotein TssJ [Terasakiispira papahanaumokuakeensis]|uniref:type VI secretion system lipoprotein TssJ n=1 Tax=Terasakiispira papahanaumokuakeensis TaxID=197479 RepID=UPI000A042FE8|nr:type VI secretion system lipoprotein TssJ [Terasakiispira papahanaumokuakeensis]